MTKHEIVNFEAELTETMIYEYNAVKYQGSSGMGLVIQSNTN